jgi:hypothetical protein
MRNWFFDGEGVRLKEYEMHAYAKLPAVDVNKL